ncbi:uncharacterized protein LOC123218951 [Mangifera indica]|uniref:uncharacterized protein LOC123218951 n=1 Tax=Mangifera indica TaxID=29780 RepID=UPI001CFB9B48|nr:uncharacterized protein LOC123218951 [Mangifera indica]
MASSKKLASCISSIASSFYFFLIFFQVPLFRVQCRNGICTTPIEVTASQSIANEVFPEYIIRTLLYPGAFANAILKGSTIPSYNKLLNLYHFTNLNNASVETDIQCLEILAGSYLSVAGALLGPLRAGKMSLFGTLITLWGLVKEVSSVQNPDGLSTRKVGYIYPTMLIAVLCAFLSIRRDLRKIIQCCRASRPIANSKH